MDFPKRKQVRLAAYDYSAPGAYFVTVCTQNRRCILSEIRRGDPCGRPSLTFSPYGEIVAACIKHAAELYGVQINPFVIMPNHIHFICTIDSPRATARAERSGGRPYAWSDRRRIEIPVSKPMPRKRPEGETLAALVPRTCDPGRGGLSGNLGIHRHEPRQTGGGSVLYGIK